MTIPALLHQREFSPRRGFTVVGPHTTAVGPIVVRFDGSPEAFAALRSAADLAMVRRCQMVVLGHARPWTKTELERLDDRDRAVAKSILRNRHVIKQDFNNGGLKELAARCQELEASVLVLSCVESEAWQSEPTQIADLDCDVLMVAR